MTETSESPVPGRLAGPWPAGADQLTTRPGRAAAPAGASARGARARRRGRLRRGADARRRHARAGRPRHDLPLLHVEGPPARRGPGRVDHRPRAPGRPAPAQGRHHRRADGRHPAPGHAGHGEGARAQRGGRHRPVVARSGGRRVPARAGPGHGPHPGPGLPRRTSTPTSRRRVIRALGLHLVLVAAGLGQRLGRASARRATSSPRPPT